MRATDKMKGHARGCASMCDWLIGLIFDSVASQKKQSHARTKTMHLIRRSMASACGKPAVRLTNPPVQRVDGRQRTMSKHQATKRAENLPLGVLVGLVKHTCMTSAYKVGCKVSGGYAYCGIAYVLCLRSKIQCAYLGGDATDSSTRCVCQGCMFKSRVVSLVLPTLGHRQLRELVSDAGCCAD